MPEKFSFIHLSDFHFCLEPRRINLLSLAQRRPRLTLDTCLQQTKDYGFVSWAKPTSYAPHIVSGAAQFCYAHKNAVDGIIITGDLATTGQQTDIAAARDYTLAAAGDGFLSQRNRPTLLASELPAWVMPGNHDKYADNAATPKSRNFELTFGSLMPNFSRGVGHKVRRKRDELLGLIFADFCLRERADATDRYIGPYGQGRVYHDVLHELEARTRDLKRRYPNITIIWAIHFAPYDCGSALALLDWQLVAKSAETHRVLATLCGHTHIAGMFRAASGHKIYCAGSAGAIDQEDSSSVHIVDIITGRNPSIERRNFAWSKDLDEFLFGYAD